MNQPLDSVLRRMRPVTLEEMDAVKLMNRVDTKYVLTLDKLCEVLACAVEGYRVLSVDGALVNRYNTLYYDTPDIEMYRTHQRGKLVRQKVRTRTYVESGQTFLEIKKKNNKGRTRKKRIAIPLARMADFSGDSRAAEFLTERSGYTCERLRPTLYTRFRRITLVSDAFTERITIDSALSFENTTTSIRAALPQVVIVELKQDGRCYSRFAEILRTCGVHPFRLSKYCAGTALTNPQAPQCRIKWKIRFIEKLTRQTN